MGISSWPQSERPRERLLSWGVEALSDAELLGVLFGNGIKGKDAVALARELLARFGSVRGLLAARPEKLRAHRGLGVAKIAGLLAAKELVRRSLREEVIGKDVIRDPRSVVTYLCASLRDKNREVFKILFLNKANQVIDEVDLFEGTLDEAAVHPREVVKAALDRHAAALILVHNHPSGRIEPSLEDREITCKLQTALATVSITLLDHLIVGDNRFFSFSEHSLLQA